jgi:hypothetical protein
VGSFGSGLQVIIPFFFETDPERPELEGKQVVKKSKAAQTKTKGLLFFFIQLLMD